MVFESGRKARAETPRPVTKYARFLERVKKEKEPPKIIERDIKKAYQNGDLEKSEFFALIKKLKSKTESNKQAEEHDDSEKSKKKESGYNKMENEKKGNKREKEEGKELFSTSEESSSEREERRAGESVFGHGHKSNVFTKLLSNGNMRLGFFVVAMFALLFFVTKDVLSSKGNGELLIFAIVILGILFILGSSGSKSESKDHF
ncbi:MAG: hypothetical protein PHH82_00035 [Candidatus ainarchaeum sp.]|nr:hypothetical protein [Candidatus ainarchaeum sp.]